MYENLTKKISKKFGRDLTVTEIKYITDWKEQYGMLDNVIIEAVDRAIRSKTTSISFQYINAIIRNWHKQGVKSLNDIATLDSNYYKNKKKEQEKEIALKNINKKDTKSKNFMLDTNVLIHDPSSIFKFENNNIFIPHIVLEELDNFKKEKSDRGYCAREAYRILRGLRAKGNAKDGIELNEDGGRLFILFNKADYSLLPVGWDKEKMDNLILLSALSLQKSLEQDVILVTNDCGMQIKADVLGLKNEEYKHDRISPTNKETYKGFETIYLEDSLFSALCKEKPVDISDIDISGKMIWSDNDEPINLTDNEYLIVKNASNGSKLGKYFQGSIIALPNNQNVMGINPKNASQKFLMNSLMTSYDDIPLTIVNGPAGTGKTLLAIAAGLAQVMEQDTRRYKRVLVCRSNVMMDEEIGFLPGNELEKISPLLRGVYDNIDVLFGAPDDTPAMLEDKRRELFQRGYIKAESVSYLRGRSINDTFVIIDEAQNCSPRLIMSIVTRAGLRSKFVLLGDVNQCDNARLDSNNNGLIFAINRMKGREGTDIITFEEKDCVRSPLAKEASKYLKI